MNQVFVILMVIVSMVFLSSTLQQDYYSDCADREGGNRCSKRDGL